MSEMYYAMEWGYISIMHVAIKADERYSGLSLCNKLVGFPSWANPVKDYIQVEHYIDEPDFEFIDNSDTVNKAKVCINCLHIASLKLMLAEAES